MNARITCTTAVRKAHDATAGLSGLWHAAYDAVAADVAAGASLREVSEALRASGVKASKDLVRDYELAARLTVYGSDYDAALVAARTKKKADGTVILPSSIMFGHSIITGARNTRGIRYVTATLDAMDNAIGESDMSGDAVRKIIEASLRDLLAEKRSTTNGDKKDDKKGEETASEETGETVAPTPTAATADTCLRSAASILEGVLKSWSEGTDVPSDDAVTAFLAVAARLATMGKARRDKAVAV